jgi:hypothetical protein
MNIIKVINFKFSIIDRISHVLISGAVVDVSEDSVTKLEGRPVAIALQKVTNRINDDQVDRLIQEIETILRNKRSITGHFIRPVRPKSTYTKPNIIQNDS